MEQEQQVKFWRGLAVSLLCIITLAVIGLLYFYDVGTEVIERENKCIDQCLEIDGVENYAFDIMEDTCYCMNAEEEVIQQFNMG